MLRYLHVHYTGQTRAMIIFCTLTLGISPFYILDRSP
jgi:hypothetical protein